MWGIIAGILAGLATLSMAAPLAAESSSTASINLDVTTSTVQQDLYCFYHDQYPVNTLSYLVPHKANGDQYDDFKFITQYAYKGDLYFYFYVDYKCPFRDVYFEYSDSTTLSEDKTTIVETPHEVDDAFKCTIHDCNGEQKRFYKICAKNFYKFNVGDKHRCKALRVIGYVTDITYVCRLCEDAEYSWVDPAEGADQVYTYYKDNYILLSGTSSVTQLVPTKYTSISEHAATEVKEINWLFFTWDYTSKGVNYDLGKLVKAEVAYDWLTYDVTYRVDDGTAYAGCYQGLYKNQQPWFDKNGHWSREAEFSNEKSVRAGSTVTPSDRSLSGTTSSATIFFFWNITHTINYKYNTIQALDDSSLGKIGDADFKKFCTDNRADYKYAIDFREATRTLNKTEDSWSNARDFFHSTRKVYSTCHEARETVITKLSFQNQDGTAELNAIMNPVNPDYAVTTTPVEKVTVTFINKKADSITKGLLIALACLAGLVGLILLTFWLIKLWNSPYFAAKRYQRAYQNASMPQNAPSNQNHSANNQHQHYTGHQHWHGHHRGH
jgi:hypothetical protein